MRIGALFTDYDGTIAPRDVRRDASAVPPTIARPLSELARRIPVAVITSKDYAFVRPRTDFASAWACCGGLELDMADGRTITSPRLADLSDFFSDTRRTVPDGCVLEEKRSRDGRLVGFCLDWTGGSEPEDLRGFMSLVKRRRLHLDHVPGNTFVDVYSRRPDKGRAVLALKKLLGVGGAVAYLGDSLLDNPAFDASDVAIGVIHGGHARRLRCDTEVEFGSLGHALEGLLEENLEWKLDRTREREVRA